MNKNKFLWLRDILVVVDLSDGNIEMIPYIASKKEREQKAANENPTPPHAA